MEADRILIGALIFIVLIVGSNFVTYGIARGWTKTATRVGCPLCGIR
jgi:hypothetical protein